MENNFKTEEALFSKRVNEYSANYFSKEFVYNSKDPKSKVKYLIVGHQQSYGNSEDKDKPYSVLISKDDFTLQQSGVDLSFLSKTILKYLEEEGSGVPKEVIQQFKNLFIK